MLSFVGCLRLILAAAPTRVGTVTRAAWPAAIAWLAACPTGLLLDPSFTLSFRTICLNLCIHTKPHRGALSWPGDCGRAASRGRILCFRYNWFGRRRQTLSLSDTRVARGNQACRGPDAVSTPPRTPLGVRGDPALGSFSRSPFGDPARGSVIRM